jgi:hypothetical protein
MRVALQVEVKLDKKEPLGALIARAHAAFAVAGLAPPEIRFTLSDLIGGGVSAVERALKRHPALARFEVAASPMPGLLDTRRLANPAGEAIDLAVLTEIANGVPRSFPFHMVAVSLCSPDFGALPEGLGVPIADPGLVIHDAWWVSGRQRAMTATVIVEGEARKRALPPLPPAIEALIAALGPARKPKQFVLPEGPPVAAPDNPAATEAVAAIVRDWHDKLADTVARAALPHGLPATAAEARAAIAPGAVSGPRKPALEAAFKPLGYAIKGGSGTFTLRRRTGGNNVVEIDLDVGTWSRSLTALFRVVGLGFRAPHPLPVTRHATARPLQYPIGDAAQWGKLVENMAAMVAELERGFVPAIEAAAGPSPDWFDPPP